MRVAKYVNRHTMRVNNIEKDYWIWIPKGSEFFGVIYGLTPGAWNCLIFNKGNPDGMPCAVDKTDCMKLKFERFMWT